MKARPFLLLLVVSALATYGATTPRESLLVLSKADHMLAIVDPSSLQVVARMPVGNDPHEVVASTDGKLAYVSNYGGGAFNTLAVIDLIGQKALPLIGLGPLWGPHGLTYVGGKAWFTAEAAKAIGSYDPAKKQIDFIMGTGQNRTHMIYVSEDQSRIYTTNISSATVSLLEKVTRSRAAGPGSAAPSGASQRPRMGSPAGDWEQTVIPVGKGAEGFDMSPKGKELWTANAQDGTVSIIDMAGKQVAETLSVDVRGANRLKFNPAGDRVLISSLSNSNLTILDPSTRKVIKHLDLGHSAAGIQMQPDGARAFVACTPGNYVVAIDLKTLEISGKFDVGPQPDGMAWAVQR